MNVEGSLIVEPNKYFHGWPISKSPEDVAVKVVKDMLYVLTMNARGDAIRMFCKATTSNITVVESNIGSLSKLINY